MRKTITMILFLILLLFVFISTLYTQKLNNFDYYLTKISTILLLCLLGGLIFNINVLIDFVHILLPSFFSLYANVNNTYLLLLHIVVINFILFHWSYFEECPLGTYGKGFEFMNYITNNYQYFLNNVLYVFLLILYTRFYRNILFRKKY
jgi:hypothetical protein